VNAWRDERGAVLVEFAIIAPIIALMAVGILDVGTAMLQSMSLAFVTQGRRRPRASHPGPASPGRAPSSRRGRSPRDSSLRRTGVGDGGRSDGHRPGRFGQRCSLLATQQQAVVKGVTLKC